MLTPDEGGGLIGIAFRIASGAMIFTSDVMTNSGYVVPKNRVLESNDHLTDYMRVSNHLSFLDYFNEYFYPYFQKKRPGLTKEALIHSLGLKSIEGYLKGNPKFNVMTNDERLHPVECRPGLPQAAVRRADHHLPGRRPPGQPGVR